jgi:hypothetical protein
MPRLDMEVGGTTSLDATRIRWAALATCRFIVPRLRCVAAFIAGGVESAAPSESQGRGRCLSRSRYSVCPHAVAVVRAASAHP